MSFTTTAIRMSRTLIRAPPGSISHLASTISAQPSHFPPSLRSFVQELASKDASPSESTPTKPADPSASTGGVSDQEYGRLMDEMISSGNGLLKLVSERADKMGSEEVYDEQVLDLYDSLVWGFNSPFLWRITQSDVQSLYSNNVLGKHAEIGVGTGLFLPKDVTKRCEEIALMDLNENSLNVCERRILDSYRNGALETVTKPNVTKLISDITSTNQSALKSLKGPYQSVSANFLFHCLHGPNLHSKLAAFQNCASLLTAEGVFIGSTILGKDMSNDPEGAGESALGVLKHYNEVGIFGNLGDSYEDLEEILNGLFTDVELRVVGYCGAWVARNPK